CLPPRPGQQTGIKLRAIFLVLFFLLLAAWFVAWALMHVASGAIHLLLVIAVISLIMHLFRGRTAV
ncbi:MAG: hypothetical protein QOJ99_789, partial [Bryobacterales bacterium]|nr:hypothetical protein [Bryobacterales bacterium]